MSIKLNSSSSTCSRAAAESEVAAGELGSKKLGSAAGGRESKLPPLLEGLERKDCHGGEASWSVFQ